MENLFMYGISGADLDDCESFLTGLDSQANNSQTEELRSSGFIPSPQEMLSTGVDPYAGQYDQVFTLDQNQWQYPVPQIDQQIPENQRGGPEALPRELPQDIRDLPMRGGMMPASLPSPPVKSESDSHEDEEAYYPDAPDISLEAGGISKRPRARKAKTSHNMIEKRYRNNINDKINILRDAVPGLREAAATTVVDGIPSIRLNKATVLTKAAEYIEQLKSRNSLLLKENTELRAKVTPRYQGSYPQQQGGSGMGGSGMGGSGMGSTSGAHTPHAGSHTGVNVHGSGPQQRLAHHPQQGLPSGSSQSLAGNTPVQHYVQRQPQRPHMGRNVALGLATTGLVATGSVLSSGDGNFRGLAVLPFPQLGWLLKPSSSALKFTGVAFVCFCIGVIWVSVLNNWSRNMKRENVDVLTPHHYHRLSTRENALYRLKWPLNPTYLSFGVQILGLFLQAAIALVIGSKRLEHLKVTFGYPSDRQAGYYVYQLMDTDLTGTSSIHSCSSLCVFLMSIVHPSPYSSMLQAIHVRMWSAKLNNMRTLNALADRLWMRRGATLVPSYLQALRKIPLSEIVEQQHAHITITSRGIQVSDFVANNTADPKILNTVDLFACLHAYGLQDRTLLGLLDYGTPDMRLFELSGKIAPPSSYAALRAKGLGLLLTDDVSQFNTILQQIQREVPGRPVQMSFPRVVSCAFTKWLAKDPNSQAFAESILAVPGPHLSVLRSSVVFVAYYIALRALNEQGLGRSNLVSATLELRSWLGSNESLHFGLSQQRRKELINETLEFASNFASRESDEACFIPDEVVYETLAE